MQCNKCNGHANAGANKKSRTSINRFGSLKTERLRTSLCAGTGDDVPLVLPPDEDDPDEPPRSEKLRWILGIGGSAALPRRSSLARPMNAIAALASHLPLALPALLLPCAPVTASNADKIVRRCAPVQVDAARCCDGRKAEHRFCGACKADLQMCVTHTISFFHVLLQV